MNRILTFLILFTLISPAVIPQPVPNAGFENWVTPGSYSNPQDWDSPNAVTTAIPIIGGAVVTKSAGGHSGSWCAKLENKSFIVYTVPGVITLGTLSIDLVNFNFGLTGGVPFTDRPDVFKGFYKYSPQGGDTCAFLVIFYRHNVNGGQDTIGLGYFLDNTAKTTWTGFEAPIEWFSTEAPDTMNIIIAANASLSPSSGSALYVDDLSFDYYSGVSTIKPGIPLSVDFNRNTKAITVSMNLTEETQVITRVVNLVGQTVRFEETTVAGQKNVTLGMEDQPRGLYVVDVTAGNRKLVKKIVVN